MNRSPFPVRTEADVLALVPVTLGFHPEDSLVLITLGPEGRPFHARIDLPDSVDDLTAVVVVLVRAAVRNGGERAIVVAYSDDECLVDVAVGTLVEALQASGIDTLAQLRADGARWFPLGREPADPRRTHGVPYDVRSHQLTSQAILEGRVTFRNREELVESLTVVDPEVVDEVVTAFSAMPLLSDDQHVLRDEGRWLVAQVHGLLRRFEPPPAVVQARLLRALARRDLRDLAWCEITSRDADAHAGLWREVVRRSPEELVAPAAGLLAFAAWLAGDGALAWAAVDRCLASDPDHTLGRLVAQALEAAVPPSSWQRVDPRSLPLSGE